MIQDEHLDNRNLLSEEAIHLIMQDFGRYQDPIPQAVVKYLVDGGDDRVLQQLQSRYMPWPDERSVESHNWPPAPSDELRSQMLHCLTTQDIEFYYRLTRTYADEAENLQWYRPLSLDWLSLFLFFLVNFGRVTFSLEQPLALPPAITANLIESLLLRVGQPADQLARLVFLADIQQADPLQCAACRAAWIGASLPEFSAYSLKHESVIQAALTHPALEQRVHALDMLTLCQMSPVPFASLLVDRATATSKLEREAALPILQRDSIAMTPLVQAKVQSGKATERAHAARLLLDLAGAGIRVFLEEHLQVEQTASVRDAIEQVLIDLAILNAPEAEITLSPLPTVVLEAPLPQSAREAIHAVLTQLYESAQATYEAHQYQQHPDVPLPQPPSVEFIDHVYHCLQFGTVTECLGIAPIYHRLAHLQAAAQFRQLLQIPELEVIHVARLLLLLQLFCIESQVLASPCKTIPQGMHWKESEINTDLQRWCQQRQPHSSLRYLTSSLEALGIAGETIAWKMLTWEESPFWAWGDRAIGEYFVEHRSILATLFELGPFPQLYFTHEQSARRQLFRILALLPTLPARFTLLLWEIALNGVQGEMPLAQRCLDHRPGTQDRLHQLVAHSDPAIQLTVIQWLTRLKDPTAISQFQAALGRQPTSTVRDALLRALEKLGASIDEFLDRSQLLQEAQVGLQKGVPKALSWFPFDALPSVHWQDTGAPVAPEILTWFVVQNYQQKNPEPSPVLRQYVKLWNETDRQQFGQIVLESWIHQDTQVTSAVKEKGILSVAGACGGAAMVPVINHYLKTYFGKRLSQCLALLQMLTWSDDFAAIQLLLTIATRFRTQKIQQAAQQGVQQLAERQGWTLTDVSVYFPGGESC
ncbi:MAG TPA: HEAT repeat domain-containing protein [Allocoleopsis sp.]